MNAAFSEPSVDSLLRRFFCDYLLQQRELSPRTVASYRDTFRLLLRFMEKRLRKPPERLTLADWDAPQIMAFLDNLEQERKNSARSRNNRLAAIRTFMHYAARNEPATLTSIRRVLAIPQKRYDKPVVDFLSREEITAFLQAADPDSWSGRRDRAMLGTLYNTGARASELVGLDVEDLCLEETGTLRIRGKGRKERVVPLWKTTREQLRKWLRQISGDPQFPLFPNRRGERLTRSGLRSRIRVIGQRAAKLCPTLDRHRLSPHLFRHYAASRIMPRVDPICRYCVGKRTDCRPVMRHNPMDK